MNIKALTKKYEAVECVVGIVSGKTILTTVLRDLKQLDEPEKLKIPQFVADWIEYCKVKKITLAHALYRSEEAKNKSVYHWIFEGSGHQETFARAWLDGYEVEEEKRYTVVIKETKQPLYYNAGEKKLFFSLGGLATKFTRKELEEAGFGWVFSCEGIKIEEVEG